MVSQCKQLRQHITSDDNGMTKNAGQQSNGSPSMTTVWQSTHQKDRACTQWFKSERVPMDTCRDTAWDAVETGSALLRTSAQRFVHVCVFCCFCLAWWLRLASQPVSALDFILLNAKKRKIIIQIWMTFDLNFHIDQSIKFALKMHWQIRHDPPRPLMPTKVTQPIGWSTKTWHIT